MYVYIYISKTLIRKITYCGKSNLSQYCKHLFYCIDYKCISSLRFKFNL